MYKGFVRPLLEYGPLVWMGSSTTSLAQLDRVQRRALHIISEHTWLPSLSLRRLCYHIPVQAPLPRPVLTAPLHYSAASGPDPQYPLHAIPQLRCLAPPTSAVERYSSHCSLQPASCFSYRDRPHLEFSPTASPRPSPVARPYAGMQRLASSASSGVTTAYGLLTHSHQPAPCVAPHDHILILLFSVRTPTSPTHLSSLHSLLHPPPYMARLSCVDAETSGRRS